MLKFGAVSELESLRSDGQGLFGSGRSRGGSDVMCAGRPVRRGGSGPVDRRGSWCWRSTLCWKSALLRAAAYWSSVARSSCKLLTSNALRKCTFPDRTSAYRTAQASENRRAALEGSV